MPQSEWESIEREKDSEKESMDDFDVLCKLKYL